MDSLRLSGKRIGVVLAVISILLALAVAGTGPVSAQASSGLGETFAWLGAAPSDADALASDATQDGLGDTFRFAVPGSEPATLDLGTGDIVSYVATAAEFEGFGPDRAPDVPCNSTLGDALVLCQNPATVTLDGPFWVFAMELGGEIPQGDVDLFHSLAFPVLTNGGIPWEPRGDFLWDTFQGTDLWLTVERVPGADWSLQAIDSATFTPTDTGAFAVILGSTLTVAVPAESLGFIPMDADVALGDDPDRVRTVYRPDSGAARSVDAAFQALDYPCFGTHVHIHNGTFGQTSNDLSIVDSGPDTNTNVRRTPDLLAKPRPGTITIGGDPPPETTQPTEAPTSPPPTTSPTSPPPTTQQTSAPPTTTPTSPPPTTAPDTTPVTVADGDDDGDGSGGLLIFIGVLVLLAGLGIFFGPRLVTKTDDDDFAAGSSTDPKEEPYCDWAAYYIDRLGREIPLREPKGHRCCYYRIQVVTGAAAAEVSESKEETYRIPLIASMDNPAKRRTRRKFVGDGAGIESVVHSDAEWQQKARKSVALPANDGWLPTVEVSGALVTEVEVSVVRKEHCLGNDAHKFKTDEAESSGEASIEVSCQHRKITAACDNAFKAHVLELASAVDATDLERYEVQKKVLWSTTEVKGAGWTMTTGTPEFTLGANLSKEVKKSLGPLDLSGKIGTGVSVAYDPGGDHNRPPAKTPLAAKPGTGGIGTHSRTYAITFANAVSLKVEHKQKEQDLTGSWSDYKSRVSASVDIAHKAKSTGKTEKAQWESNHADRKKCCRPATEQGCKCLPEMKIEMRGEDERTVSGGKVPAVRWKMKVKGRETYADAFVVVDRKKFGLRRPKATKAGRSAWDLVNSPARRRSGSRRRGTRVRRR